MNEKKKELKNDEKKIINKKRKRIKKIDNIIAFLEKRKRTKKNDNIIIIFNNVTSFLNKSVT